VQRGFVAAFFVLLSHWERNRPPVPSREPSLTRPAAWSRRQRTLTSASTSATREADNGRTAIRIPAIGAGRYRLSVRRSGFKTAERSAIELAPNQHLSLGAIQLDVGDVSESVTVKADAATVQTASWRTLRHHHVGEVRTLL